MTMKKTLLALCLAAAMQASVAATPTTTSVKEMDRIVAVVNKIVITNLDLQTRISEVMKQLEAQKVTPPARDILAKQVLEQMITEEVQMQYAAENGISIDNKDVDSTIANLATQNKLTVPAMKAQLEKEGVPFPRFQKEIKRELTLNRLRDTTVGSRVVVTDSDVDQVLKSELGNNRSEYHLANILVGVQERADSKQIEAQSQKAEKALADLKAGRPFSQLAATYSDAPNAMKGGDLGWRPATSLPSEFVSMLEKLKPGEHTGIIRSQQGFYIFQLLEKRSGGAPVMVEQYHTYHILIKTNEIVSDNDAKTKILQIRDRILRGAKFEDMAKLYSDDASNTKGGELGWVNLGDTVPEFEKVMTSLKPNTVSEPVRTPFGWHLILVTEKRTQDVSKERERFVIKQQIRMRKLDEAYADWVRQLRDSAYVEEHLDDNK